MCCHATARQAGCGVTVWEVVAGGVAAGAAGEVLAGLLVGPVVGVVLLGEVPLEEGAVGGVVGAGVVDSPGGDVARGGGQGGSRESADNFRSCDSA